MTDSNEQKNVADDPGNEILINTLILPLVQNPIENGETSQMTLEIVKNICEERSSELIDFCAARRLEDWSILSHQVVGYESN